MEINGNVGVFQYQISVSKVRFWLWLLWSQWVWATGFPLSKTFGGVRTKPELLPAIPRTVVRWVYICITFTWISLQHWRWPCCRAGLRDQTADQLKQDPCLQHTSPQTEHARRGPDLSRHLHCSCKQIDGFTHSIEPCCAVFSHFLLDWGKRGSRGVPLCQHFSNGGKTNE